MSDALNPPADAADSAALTGAQGEAREELASNAIAELEKAQAVANARFRPMALPSTPFWLVLIACVIGLALLIAGSSTLFMFAVGIVLTAIALPIVEWMSRHGVSRTLAALIVVGAMVLLAALAIIGFAAFIANRAIPFLAGIPDYLTTFQSAVNASANAPDWLKDGVNAIVNALMAAMQDVSPGAVALGALGGLLGFVGTILTWTLLPFFVFYLISDQPKMRDGFWTSVPSPWQPHLQTAINIVTGDFGRYFKAELIVGSIMGVTVTIGVYIIGLIVGGPLKDFAVLFGLLAAVMELLPQIGPIISMIPALLLSLTISPVAFLITGAFYLTIFTIESNLLVPSIEGDVVEFSRPAVLFLIAMGLAIGGIVGAILALPVAAIARDLFAYLFHHAEHESLIQEPVQT